jgi:hypothetical protein
LLKFTTHLQRAEHIINGDNYFVCASLLASGFPDNDIRGICNAAMRDAADKKEEESELSDNKWKDLCQAILIKLFGTAYEVTSLASRWFRTDSCGPREASREIGEQDVW